MKLSVPHNRPQPVRPQLPLKQEVASPYILSLVIVALTLAASMAGLALRDILYSTAELQANSIPNDAVNLLLGVPILLVAMALSTRGQLLGLLCWPGALLYGFYNYTAYLFGIPWGWLSLVNGTIVLLSAATIFLLMRQFDPLLVYERLAGKVPVNAAAVLLLFFGFAFFFRAIGILIEPAMGLGPWPTSEIGVLIADLVVSMAWIAGGVLLFRQRPWGYAAAPGLLFAASMLFIGLILVLLVRPVLTSVPFDLEEFIVIVVMALICFIPSGLFLRRIW